MFHRKKRGRKRTDSYRRKDRLIQTRVGERLERAIKAEAKRRRVTVSHLLRNVLEDCFNLVDDVVEDVDKIVSNSLELAHKVGFSAKRSRRSYKYNRFDEQPTDDEAVYREDSEAVNNRHPSDDEKGNTELVTDRDEVGKDPLGHIYAWNKVVLSQNVLCSICNCSIEKGQDGYIGLSDDPGSERSWLCKSCLDKL